MSVFLNRHNSGSGNRFAHLYFFTEILRIEAWLVNVYFIDDRSIPTPTSRTMWELE
jgi:hypothetical protein